jgi:Uma2 family endonuclease
MSTAIATTSLLTAEEFLNLPDDGKPSELVLGRRVELNRPFSDHGYRMGKVYLSLSEYVLARNLGRLTVGDTGVITHRNPDSVRGPDIAYYSFERVPEGPLPEGYWPSPDLTVEIKSPSDRWPEIYVKVGEYLDANVLCVMVVDPKTSQVQVFTQDQPSRIWNSTETLILPTGLPGFSVPVAKLFE